MFKMLSYGVEIKPYTGSLNILVLYFEAIRRSSRCAKVFFFEGILE
jgi:hypothetical protein